MTSAAPRARMSPRDRTPATGAPRASPGSDGLTVLPPRRRGARPPQGVASHPAVETDAAQVEQHAARVSHEPHVAPVVVPPHDGHLGHLVPQPAREPQDLGIEPESLEALATEELPRGG